MAKKNQKKCRDCKECRKSGLGKMMSFGTKIMVDPTLGVGNKIHKSLAADVCPICGHRMHLHANPNAPVSE